MHNVPNNTQRTAQHRAACLDSPLQFLLYLHVQKWTQGGWAGGRGGSGWRVSKGVWRLVGKKSSGWWPPAEAVWQGISIIPFQSEAPFLGSVILDVSPSTDASNAALKTASGLVGENWEKLSVQIKPESCTQAISPLGRAITIVYTGVCVEGEGGIQKLIVLDWMPQTAVLHMFLHCVLAFELESLYRL